MITINDIKTTLRASANKGFNKDLFLNDSEIVDINEISEQKEKAIFWLNGESNPVFNNQGEIIKQSKNYICISQDSKDKTAFYSINSSISKYNNEIQKSYFRQQLTNKGLLWLVNKTNTDERIISMVYNLVLLNEDINVKFDDLLILAVIKPSGSKIVEFETFNHIISIIINKDNKLVDINKKVITTNKKELSFDDGLSSDDTFEPEKEVINNSFFDDEL